MKASTKLHGEDEGMHHEGIRPRIKVVNSSLGHLLLGDGTLIVVRVAVVDVRVTQRQSPFGAEFGVDLTTGVSSRSPHEVLEKFRDKRILAPGERPPDSWQQLRIDEKEPAVEEVEFEDSELGKYRIRVELEPIMVSVNTDVRTARGEPLYVVRWVPKVSWKKVE
mgnify:CR=1 FL=1